MKNMLIFFMLFIGCSTVEEESQNRGGFGELIREGYPNEINPFEILERVKENGATTGFVIVNAPTILKEDVGDYYPLRLAGSPYAYVLSIKVSAEYYTEEEYLISLRTLTRDWKDCSEVKKVTFYRIGEEDGTAEYRSRKPERNAEGDYEGVYIFFAQKEMPSYDWYHVLKVCSTEGNRGFRLEGIIL
jgi:hypothetical protein